MINKWLCTGAFEEIYTRSGNISRTLEQAYGWWRTRL